MFPDPDDHAFNLKRRTYDLRGTTAGGGRTGDTAGTTGVETIRGGGADGPG